MQFKRLILHVYTFFGTVNPNLRSIFKPEVELTVFLRMRSYKITTEFACIICIACTGKGLAEGNGGPGNTALYIGNAEGGS